MGGESIGRVVELVKEGEGEEEGYGKKGDDSDVCGLFEGEKCYVDSVRRLSRGDNGRRVGDGRVLLGLVKEFVIGGGSINGYEKV
nr:hypothetical protein [Bacillus thuringiensis]